MKCMDSVKGITPLNTRFPPVFLLPWNLSSWKVLKVLVWAAAPHFRALRLEKCFSRAPHKHTEPQITCLIFIKKYYSISVRSMQKMLSSEFPGASWSLNVHRNTATRLHQNTQYHKRNNRCNTLNLTTHNPSKRIHLQSRSNVNWSVMDRLIIRQWSLIIFVRPHLQVTFMSDIKCNASDKYRLLERLCVSYIAYGM